MGRSITVAVSIVVVLVVAGDAGRGVANALAAETLPSFVPPCWSAASSNSVCFGVPCQVGSYLARGWTRQRPRGAREKEAWSWRRIQNHRDVSNVILSVSSPVDLEPPSSSSVPHVDEEEVAALEQAVADLIRITAQGNEEAARELSNDFMEQMDWFLQESDNSNNDNGAVASFLTLAIAILNHRPPTEVMDLGKELLAQAGGGSSSSPYSLAWHRLSVHLEDCAWDLGSAAERLRWQQEQTLEFETYEQIRDAHVKEQQQQQEQQRQKNDEEVWSPDGSPRCYYAVLRVNRDATSAEIKSAYRSRAKDCHPDANPDDIHAKQKFQELGEAYAVLHDEEKRASYDKYGRAGLHFGDVSTATDRATHEEWEEFTRQPKKENSKSRARRASAEILSLSEKDDDGVDQMFHECVPEHLRNPDLPIVGNIVIYPLSETARQTYNDGRTHGLGLLCGRNIDRGDVEKLSIMSPEHLDLTEVTPLSLVADQVRAPDSNSHGEGSVWEPDPLGISAYPRLTDLKVVAVQEFHQGYDQWTMDAPDVGICLFDYAPYANDEDDDLYMV